jgi:Icc-related predicted phosphoesterase
MRVFAVSDLHTDFRDNWRTVQRVSRTDYQKDVLLVAGDIADRMEVIRDTLATLRSRFQRVFYMPGNHELWVRGDTCDSMEKLRRVLDLCKGIGVETQPSDAGGVWIVPLFSWYSSRFDLDNSGAEEELEGWADFHFCKWRQSAEELAEQFSRMNEPSMRRYKGPVISFSHFLPRRDLLPSVDYLRFKGLPKVAGCSQLETQVRLLGSSIHVFGHSHINRDCVIDGVRYVQNALSYPRERRISHWPEKVVWDSEEVLTKPVESS